jgi:hypothetical protein
MKNKKRKIIFNFDRTETHNDSKNIELYSVMKNKLENKQLSIIEYENILEAALNRINIIGNIDFILIPDSDNKILEDICKKSKINYRIIKKNPVSEIIK